MKSLMMMGGVLALLTTTARADSRGYVSAGAELGNDMGLMGNGGVAAGLRLGSLPVFARAAIAAGRFDDAVGAFGDGEQFLAGSGSFVHARIGAEVEHCLGPGALCLVGGVDLGYLRTGDVMGLSGDSRYEQLHAIPRAGIDVGGERLRFRALLDARWGITGLDGPDRRFDTGLHGAALETAVVYRF